jgi:dTDP-4-dehydrorhamnose reductase
MKILLFGASGQLGREILQRANDLHFDIVFPSHQEIDITHEAGVDLFIKRIKPDLVINSAAFTAVERAEDEPAPAYAINADAPRYIARACNAVGARMFHLSTDYVFAGDTGLPLTESDPTNPVNTYGKSKLAGEIAVKEELPNNSLTIRTSSLHGKMGNNIVHTLIQLFNSQETMRFVNDQIMTPTWAGFLAEVLLDLSRIQANGIVHVAGKGQCSWFEFAQTVYKYAIELKLCSNKVEIIPVQTSEYKTKARRPAFSVLDTSYLEKLLGRSVITWQLGLRRHMEQLTNEKS